MRKLGFSAKEAADILGVSDWTIRRLIADGALAKVPHLGDRVVIAGPELERFAFEGVKQVAS